MHDVVNLGSPAAWDPLSAAAADALVVTGTAAGEREERRVRDCRVTKPIIQRVAFPILSGPFGFRWRINISNSVKRVENIGADGKNLMLAVSGRG